MFTILFPQPISFLKWLEEIPITYKLALFLTHFLLHLPDALPSPPTLPYPLHETKSQA